MIQYTFSQFGKNDFYNNNIIEKSLIDFMNI
jgi:hypothetical protein